MKFTSFILIGLASTAFAAVGPTFALAAGEAAPNGFDRVRDVPHGKVATETYDSKSLGFQRKLTVYTPPGYGENTSEISRALPAARSGRRRDRLGREGLGKRDFGQSLRRRKGRANDCRHAQRFHEPAGHACIWPRRIPPLSGRGPAPALSKTCSPM